MTTSSTLTISQRDKMAHAIGHASAKGCSTTGGRNHYVTSPDDSDWTALVNAGLAEVVPSSLVGSSAVFRVTAAGMRALERALSHVGTSP